MFAIFDWAGVIKVGTKYRNEKNGFDISSAGHKQSMYLQEAIYENNSKKEDHRFCAFDLVLLPFLTRSVTRRLLLTVFGARLHDPEKSADPIDLYIHRLTEQLEALHCC
jgi:hypothetical protein